MPIPASGPIRASMIRDEFLGPTPTFRLGAFRRGGSYVRKNAANNPTTNLAAGVTDTTVPLRLNVFRSQTRGWTYTNATLRTGGYTLGTQFGDDWEVDWPKTYINNNTFGATAIGHYALTITGGKGRVDFINNGEIQGAGGAANSGGGGIALRIQTTAQLYVTNNGAIRGGGGGGGHGGAGGTGGSGYYVTSYTAQEGPTYHPSQYNWSVKHPAGSGPSVVLWAGVVIGNPNYTVTSIASGGYTYYRNALITNDGSYAKYDIYRTWPASYNTYTNGGGGGAGGNGGRGQGYNQSALAGTGGSAGAAGGTNAGAGGTGGTGGAGGGWGANGGLGNTGNTGGYGNYSGTGSAGAAGSVGGSGNYAIYADTAWFRPVTGTINGPVGPTAPL